MRYALYFTPPVGDRLTRLASSWLGRNAFSGKTLEPPVVTGLNAAEIAFHTAAPRRYGFHGTLKAPFSLREGTSEAELLRALMLFCSGLEPFEISASGGQPIGTVLRPDAVVSRMPPSTIWLAGSSVNSITFVPPCPRPISHGAIRTS